MALSNTAAPRYYVEFREQVKAGRIPVCEQISQEMNRIDALIENPDYWYDDLAVEGFLAFCEAELTLADGSDLHLLPSFKLWAEQIFAWYYFAEVEDYDPETDVWVKNVVKKRLVVKQYLIVARGAAKSMYAYLLQAYFLIVDNSTTQQITTAPTMKQSEEVMQPFRTSIVRAKGPVFQFLTEGSMQNTTGSRLLRQKLVSTKKGIENFLTNSILEVRPMAIDKFQGLKPKIVTIDEWLSGDVREDVVGAAEQGAGKNPDYLVLAISSEGTVRNGSGDTVKMELAKILKGEYYDPHTSIWWYRLDDLTEIDNPLMWVKAQPNLGKTVSYETYQRDVDRIQKVPSTRNDIIAKRFGIPMEGYTYFFTYEETLPNTRVSGFWQLPCALGADLSQGDDFCAFTFLFPLRDGFGLLPRSYITQRTLDKLPGAMRIKYQEFMDEGTLVIFDTPVLDMMDVYDDLEHFIEVMEFDVRAFGYDPYNAKEFVQRWIAENGEWCVEKVIQGAKTESVPLGEMKIFAEQGAVFFAESLMTFCMGNAMTLEDTNGNRKLLKARYDEKIDNVSAWLDAYVVYKLFKEAFE